MMDKPENVKLMSRLPKEDYDAMIGSYDDVMIFLDHRFTIPNFPSRLLLYAGKDAGAGSDGEWVWLVV